ncbi:Clavaminate synthase-like protein [Glarea lozoyensis ATCC 20868]|uniref:Clavaminate synthase-like protein n=1 Tax=Glarea lozoyensis (strain ATCC 20868 / MF5171) TaxID=1116229 RepID=S3D504_GLAL2|nr:Clavaminate synthase-like protein [Glarea lozoyensis ATCC 20868]EPE33537.1 Clavaminate synthase-like protein [Glarea lozoyensis ATCC 20868]
MVDNNEPVLVSLQELETGSIKLSTLEQAFGPTGLGILIVKELPSNFQSLRLKLLSYISHLSFLPPDELEQLTNAESHYNVGWSHGKEALKSGQYDTMKGSYYVGILSSYLQERLSRIPSDIRPTLETPNIWPSEELLPGFRSTFEELCTLIMDIILLVARACDRFAMEHVPDYASGLLERILRESMTSRARLLHYFPLDSQTKIAPADENDDSWCALHVDDGCLTGLTSALFVNETNLAHTIPLTPLKSAKSTDPKAGLYIRSRTCEVVKVSIPADCLAFQTGSALELITGGALKAVPHFVRGPSGSSTMERVARNTLAVFAQPNHEVIVDQESGVTFGEHTKEADERHA